MNPLRLPQRTFLPCMIIITLLLAHASDAATYYVSPCGQNIWTGLDINCLGPNGPKRTIQAAINATSDGDTVFVLPGTYVEKIDFHGKAITVRSATGAENTTIDGNNSGPVVTCNSGEGPDSVLQGFRITSGSTTVDGGGMLNAFSSPTIIECRFTGNETTGNGAGMANFAASPTIQDCLFSFNWAGDEPPADGKGRGGAIYSVGGVLTIMDTTFMTCYSTDRGGVIALFNNATSTLDNCEFQTSGGAIGFGLGGAIYADDSHVSAESCMFDGISAIEGGTLMAVNDSTVQFNGCTIVDSVALNRGGAASLYDSAASFVGCSFSNLSADEGGGISVSGGSLTTTLCGFSQSNATFNAGGAIRAFDADVQLGLCTFQDNSSNWHGGAIQAMLSELTLQGCTFSSNNSRARGGAIHSTNSIVTADACTFTGNLVNYADSQSVGGGLAIVGTGNGPSNVMNCSFMGNSATTGGGLYAQGNNVTIAGCTMQDNIADWLGGGAYLTSLNSAHTIRIHDCEILENQAAHAGGGISIGGIGRVIVSATQITGNAAETGGGIRCYQNRAVFHGCRINDNTASEQGAALDVSGTTAGIDIINCLVHNNSAPSGGGAISESGEGLWQGRFHLANCTIANNVGGGIRTNESSTGSTISNAIVWGNLDGGQLIGALPTVRYSNVQGGAPGLGNMNSNPLFQGALAGNYRLLAASPCIDAGNNWALPQDFTDSNGNGNIIELWPTDFDGNPRVTDHAGVDGQGCSPITAIVDLGAFETVGEAPEDNTIFGDLTDDGIVNVSDLLAMLSGWGACATNCCAADLNVDGSVDVLDLLLMLTNWS